MIEVPYPKPSNPKFRYPKPRQRLTTIIAVECQDGVILAADGQETQEFASGLTTKQLVSKIDPAIYGDWRSSHCLLGYAGVPSYVSTLEDCVGEAIYNHQERDHFEALTEATSKYAGYVYRLEAGHSRGREIGHLASAIFMGYDSRIGKTRIYSLLPPHPPDPLRKYPFRTGTGSGWVFAGFLFNLAELLMNRLGITWRNLSTRLVAQFCYLVLAKVMNYEGYTGLSTDIYRIDHSGKVEGVSDFFPADAQGKNKIPFVLHTLMNEMKDLPPSVLEKLPALIEQYGLPPKRVIDLLFEK